MPLVDALDPVAQRIGAVNTIVNLDGRLTGHNTDWVGAVRALEEVRPLAGARVLLLGAGGAARAVAFGVREKGADVVVTNRDAAKAEALAHAVGATSIPWDGVAAAAAHHTILINATTRGMTGADPSSPLPAAAITPSHVVMDVVYKPLETELVTQARARGAAVVQGARMLLHQAAGQVEIYTGARAPLDVMESALRAALA
jgi:shikimate dehydrogenase